MKLIIVAILALSLSGCGALDYREWKRLFCCHAAPAPQAAAIQ